MNELRDHLCQTACGWLSVITGLNALNQIREEEIGVRQFHVGRNAPELPVVDALDASLVWVVEKPGNLRRATEALDDLPVRVRGGVGRVHGDIKHHV